MSVVTFSDSLRSAISAVARDCAGELEFSDDEVCSEEEILAETALDAGRLTIWGFAEADEEAKKLIKEHGWNAVVKEAAKHVY